MPAAAAAQHTGPADAVEVGAAEAQAAATQRSAGLAAGTGASDRHCCRCRGGEPTNPLHTGAFMLFVLGAHSLLAQHTVV